MDYSAIAKKYGGVQVMQPKVAPDWMEGLSPKDQAELKMSNYKQDRKRIDDLSAAIDSAAPTLNDLERFGHLNREASTGGFWNNVLPNVSLLHGSEHDEMRSIQNRLGPSQRVPGSGASSDRDVSLFLSGVPSTTQEGPVNKNIRQNFINNYNYAVEKKNAMEAYLRQNGSLMGFDETWASRGKQQTPQGPATDKAPAGQGGWNIKKVP
jgi:hypothetical protein